MLLCMEFTCCLGNCWMQGSQDNYVANKEQIRLVLCFSAMEERSQQYTGIDRNIACRQRYQDCQLAYYTSQTQTDDRPTDS